eukprot:103597-Chlamydomonas_euryale.AAC.1
MSVPHQQPHLCRLHTSSPTNIGSIPAAPPMSSPHQESHLCRLHTSSPTYVAFILGAPSTSASYQQPYLCRLHTGAPPMLASYQEPTYVSLRMLKWWAVQDAEVVGCARC